MKLPTREHLEKRLDVAIADAKMKLDVGDYHGCADACMDLREIDAQITVFDVMLESREALEQRIYELEYTLTQGRDVPVELQWPESVRAERIAAQRPILTNKTDAD